MSDDKAKWAAMAGFQAMRQADHAKRVPMSDYERGLRRGMAIARRHEWERAKTVDWTAAEAQMEREIEEARR